MRPCKIQCTFYCHHIVKIIAPPCRLLVLVLWFSQTKCGVCPKKVGKTAFFGCSEFQWTKFTWKSLLELKRYWSKVKVFWNAWAIGFQMVKLKNLFCTKIIMHGGTDADSSTDAIVMWTKNTPKPVFFEKQKKSSKTQKTQKRLEICQN